MSYWSYRTCFRKLIRLGIGRYGHLSRVGFGFYVNPYHNIIIKKIKSPAKYDATLPFKLFLRNKKDVLQTVMCLKKNEKFLRCRVWLHQEKIAMMAVCHPDTEP